VLAAYLGLLAWLALRPGPTAWMPEANFVPFTTIRSELATGTAGAWWQLLRGMLVTAPLGVLLPMAGGRLHASPLWSFLRTTGTAMLVATGVEALETGLGGKVLDVDDIVLAVIGVVLTHLAVVPAARATLLRHRPPAPPREHDPRAGAKRRPGGAALRHLRLRRAGATNQAPPAPAHPTTAEAR